jgi:hypothetical protein
MNFTLLCCHLYQKLEGQRLGRRDSGQTVKR